MASLFIIRRKTSSKLSKEKKPTRIIHSSLREALFLIKALRPFGNPQWEPFSSSSLSFLFVNPLVSSSVHRKQSSSFWEAKHTKRSGYDYDGSPRFGSVQFGSRTLLVRNKPKLVASYATWLWAGFWLAHSFPVRLWEQLTGKTEPPKPFLVGLDQQLRPSAVDKLRSLGGN